MASISSPGIGSGLDIASLIPQLMQVERKPVDRLTAQQTQISNQISAYGKIKSVLEQLQKAAAAISKPDELFTFKGTLSDSTIATVTGNSKAVGGTYSLDVEQLASSHKIAFSAPSQVPSGTLSITVGDGETVDVDIAEGASLNDVRNAINSANAGVNATIVNGQDGPQLVVSSSKTGESNTVKIETSAGLEAFSFDPESQQDVDAKQLAAATNAIMYIDSIRVESESNTVENALSGITLTLNKTTGGTPVTMTVENDTEALNKKVQDFVDAYNTVRSTLGDLSKYDSTGKATGVLNGDSTVSNIMNQLRGVLSSSPEGMSENFTNLHSLGISSQRDGTLTFDKEILAKAMQKDSAGVASTLGAFGAAFSDRATSITSAEGLVANRTDGLSANSDRIGLQIETLERRLVQVEARYLKQFSALDVLMAKYQTTSSFLTQQLAALKSQTS